MSEASAQAPGVTARDIRIGIVLVLGGTALFGCGESVVKLLARHYDTVQIVWGRYVFHAVVFMAIFARSGIVGQMRTSRPWLQFSRSLVLLLGTLLFFTALRYLALADAVAINFFAPLLVTAFSIPMLKEQVGIRRWIAILVGFAGVMVIIRPGLGVMHWAAILPLGTAVCYALYQVLTRMAGRTDHARTSLFWSAAVGTVAMSIIVPFNWTAPDAAGWVMMAATGCLFGLGHYLLIKGLERAPASVLSPFIYSQLIWATSLGFLVFGDFPDGYSILGALIVTGSGLYVWHRETRRTG